MPMAITRIVVIKDYFKESFTIHFVRKKSSCLSILCPHFDKESHQLEVLQSSITKWPNKIAVTPVKKPSSNFTVCWAI